MDLDSRDTEPEAYSVIAAIATVATASVATLPMMIVRRLGLNITHTFQL